MGEKRVALITGAAGGIGKALARRFGAIGFRLALLDIDGSRLDSAYSNGAGGTDPDNILTIPCDITDFDSCRRAVTMVTERWDRIDLVVNNAGQTHLSAFQDTSPHVFSQIMAVNVTGAFNVTQASLPALIRTRGSIVVMSSIAGLAPLPGRCVYSASKHALHGLFESLRAELAGEGVHVLLVCPGFVRTGIGDRALGGDGGPATQKRTEWGRPMEADDVAEKIEKSVAAKHAILVLPRSNIAAVILSQIAPLWYERILVRRLGANRSA